VVCNLFLAEVNYRDSRLQVITRVPFCLADVSDVFAMQAGRTAQHVTVDDAATLMSEVKEQRSRRRTMPVSYATGEVAEVMC